MAKRLFDIIIAFIAIILLIIPCIFISILILLTSSGPVIYWSRRIGSNGTHFMMPKFRTMKINTPEIATDKLLNSREHLIQIGPFLRLTSIDEFPQFLSVLKGDMSLVGPRPALHNQYDLVSKRLELGIDNLKPGITGWAQINGRDNITLDEKVRLDYEYLKKQSIVFDFKILIISILSVIRSKNIAH